MRTDDGASLAALRLTLHPSPNPYDGCTSTPPSASPYPSHFTSHDSAALRRMLGAEPRPRRQAGPGAIGLSPLHFSYPLRTYLTHSAPLCTSYPLRTSLLSHPLRTYLTQFHTSHARIRFAPDSLHGARLTKDWSRGPKVPGSTCTAFPSLSWNHIVYFKNIVFTCTDPCIQKSENERAVPEGSIFTPAVYIPFRNGAFIFQFLNAGDQYM